MGRTVNDTGTKEYQARVQRNVEEAVQAAGFGGWVCQSGPLTVECIARISAVIGIDPETWFPAGVLGATATAEVVRAEPEHSASAQTDRRPGMRRFGLTPRARFLPVR